MKEWLSSLKVGDQVAVSCGHFSNDDYVITKISKVTPSRRMEVERFKGTVFDNEGVERGVGSWSRAKRIVPVTKKITDMLELRALLSRIKEVRWESVPADKITKILNILNETPKAPESNESTQEAKRPEAEE